MKTVLYPPTINWDFLFQRPQQLLKQFALNNYQVTYINKWGNKQNIKSGIENLSIYNYDYYQENILNKRTDLDILYITWPGHHEIVDKINPTITIYDCLDYFQEWEVNADKMVKKADIIFTTSEPLYNKRKKQHSDVHLIRNACEPEHLNKPGDPPSELRNLKRPIVGFVGAVGKWVNVDILSKVAEEYTTVAVGPEFEQKLPANIIKLGMKNYNKLPHYYNHIAVVIIPFQINKTTKAVNPIKMYEYLAAGKPIVATELPEMKIYPEHIFTANNASQFLKAIKDAEKSITPSLTKERRAIAKEQSWAHRFNDIQQILDEYRIINNQKSQSY